MNIQNDSRKIFGGLAACLMMVLAGCDNPPIGDRSGRRDVSVTTTAEERSAKVLPAALIEFSDLVPRELAADLGELRLGGESGERVTVVMGDLNNKTGNIESDEFELIRGRLRNSLLQSPYIRQQIRFVESAARMAYLQKRELGVSDTPAADYNPQSTYALNGDFYRISRGDTNQYYMEFQLVHFGSNEIVFSKRYDIKQVKQ